MNQLGESKDIKLCWRRAARNANQLSSSFSLGFSMIFREIRLSRTLARLLCRDSQEQIEVTHKAYADDHKGAVKQTAGHVIVIIQILIQFL